MRLPVLLGLAIVGLTIYKFTGISQDALPGASFVAEEQPMTGVAGVVSKFLKSNRVVVFSKVTHDHNFYDGDQITAPLI